MPHKILIVGDNTLNRALLLAILKPEGHDLLTAEGGLHGIELAQREQPHLILMNVLLPGINGYDATRRLKANLATRHIPIIAMAVSAAPAERDRALDAGCDGYLAKPVDTRALPHQIRLFLHELYRSP
jgi:two-component system, cell cycle response regulator DivK